ncbi:MAG: chemotaxis protein CheD [Pseudomonadota bacterium]
MPSTTLGKQRSIYVAQGETAVERAPDVVMMAVLGSCVSVCLHDPQARVGGMNHVLLSHRTAMKDRPDFSAAASMEILINALLKAGARKSRFIASVVGGANMEERLGPIGHANVQGVMSFLKNEDIHVTSQDTGGTRARRVRFHPESGRVLVRTVSDSPVEPVSVKPAQPVRKSSDVELF